MKSLVALVLFLASTSAFAQVEKDASGSSEPVKTETKSRSQAEKRAEMRFLALAQPIGFTYEQALDVVSGASFGYFVTADLITSLDFSYAGSPGASDYDYHESITSFGASAKYFLFGSFYAKAGLGYRQITSWKYASYSGLNADGSRAKYTTDAKFTNATATVGNQWQIHYFVIGCDWVTADLPLSKTQSSTNGPDISGDSLEFLKFYLGASF